MDLWMQIEGTKLIFFMNFSVLLFFKFASRLPQTAQILVSTFKIFRALKISSFFFFIGNSRLCYLYVLVDVALYVCVCACLGLCLCREVNWGVRRGVEEHWNSAGRGCGSLTRQRSWCFSFSDVYWGRHSSQVCSDHYVKSWICVAVAFCCWCYFSCCQLYAMWGCL